MLPRPVIALLRRCARAPQGTLGLGYTVVVAGATVLYDAAGSSRPAARALGGVIALGAASILFAVVTWYRDDLVPGAAFLLAVTSTVGRLVGLEITVLAFPPPGARGPGVLALGAVFGLPIAILEWALVFGILVALGRKYRRFLSPETLPDGNSRTSAA